MFSPAYREEAENALRQLEDAFAHKIDCLASACQQKEITDGQQVAARTAFLREA